MCLREHVGSAGAVAGRPRARGQRHGLALYTACFRQHRPAHRTHLGEQRCVRRLLFVVSVAAARCGPIREPPAARLCRRFPSLLVLLFAVFAGRFPVPLVPLVLLVFPVFPVLAFLLVPRRRTRWACGCLFHPLRLGIGHVHRRVAVGVAHPRHPPRLRRRRCNRAIRVHKVQLERWRRGAWGRGMRGCALGGDVRGVLDGGRGWWCAGEEWAGHDRCLWRQVGVVASHDCFVPLGCCGRRGRVTVAHVPTGDSWGTCRLRALGSTVRNLVLSGRRGCVARVIIVRRIAENRLENIHCRTRVAQLGLCVFCCTRGGGVAVARSAALCVLPCCTTECSSQQGRVIHRVGGQSVVLRAHRQSGGGVGARVALDGGSGQWHRAELMPCSRRPTHHARQRRLWIRIRDVEALAQERDGVPFVRRPREGPKQLHIHGIVTCVLRSLFRRFQRRRGALGLGARVGPQARRRTHKARRHGGTQRPMHHRLRHLRRRNGVWHLRRWHHRRCLDAL
eukprot:m.270770 g.270770  ORF g.270770 m.270770 type:complete len:507 (-) comp19742_c0_seq1:1399-2919(-)